MIGKSNFLMYAGYILVDEGGKNYLPYRMGQEEIKMLIYCSYSLNKENMDFVERKKREWIYYDPIIEDLYNSQTEKEDIIKLIDLVKSEIKRIEEARESHKVQENQEDQK